VEPVAVDLDNDMGAGEMDRPDGSAVVCCAGGHTASTPSANVSPLLAASYFDPRTTRVSIAM